MFTLGHKAADAILARAYGSAERYHVVRAWRHAIARDDFDAAEILFVALWPEEA